MDSEAYAPLWEKLTLWARQWSSGPILVVSHVRPDGDAVGSLLAAGYLLRWLCCDVVLVSASVLPKRLMMAIPGTHSIDHIDDLSPDTKFSAAVLVDCADVERIGDCARLLSPHPVIVNIDHHPTNTRFGTFDLVDSTAPSTTFLLAEWWRYLRCQQRGSGSKELWEPDFLAALYAGLITDTGGLRYPNATPSAFRLAAELRELGVSTARLSEALLDAVTEPQLRLLGRALSTFQLACGGRIAWVQILPLDRKDCRAGVDDVEGIVARLRNLVGVELSILFHVEIEKKIHVHFRSRSHVHVGQLAVRWGGGGHDRASGFQCTGSLEEIRSAVLNAAQDALQGGACE
ncbi:DHH family phosphoesterase [Pasteuria penetrans]|uniref:DHH family phosphoesterase n=1 Tax=Pasteuria penetrans TaxID=86005 RepID=UPI00165CA7BD|nr:bifunctional oligoribonuclease/PAP phosphatase NrnA [Pasteuria penetrans]